MIYAYKDNGKWIAPVSLRSTFKGVHSWHKLTDQQRAGKEWYPCDLVNYEYDPFTQSRTESPIEFTFDGKRVTAIYGKTDKSIETIKKEVCAEVEQIRYNKIYQASIPYVFPGDTEPDGIQMRNDTDRQNIQDIVTDAIIKDPETIMYFMPTSNNLKTMTAQQIRDMGQYIKARGDNIVGYAWQLKEHIRSIERLEHFAKIDISAGWPE